jgi:hypothetical protein
MTGIDIANVIIIFAFFKFFDFTKKIADIIAFNMMIK